MARYAFHDLTLDVNQVGESGRELDQVLRDLSWVETRASAAAPSLTFSVRRRNGDGGPTFPPTAKAVFRSDAFRGLETENDFYLTDGDSLFHLDRCEGRGEARLAPSFFRRPSHVRQNFWAFGVLKLLRSLRIYSLHAAGLVAADATGLLVVGESGSGKSTLTIALIRRGWGYLSDDAILLRARSETVEAMALRRHFYVDRAAVGRYSDLPLGEEKPDRSGGRRVRLGVEAAFPAQRVDACTPRVVLFPRIAPEGRSTLRPLGTAEALGRLIAQSGEQLFDRDTMGSNLAVLKTLLRQSSTYELQAGSDLHRDPARLIDLMARAEEGEERCHVSS